MSRGRETTQIFLNFLICTTEKVRTQVLYSDSNYIVVDKMADCRVDGNFPRTGTNHPLQTIVQEDMGPLFTHHISLFFRPGMPLTVFLMAVIQMLKESFPGSDPNPCQNATSFPLFPAPVSAFPCTIFRLRAVLARVVRTFLTLLLHKHFCAEKTNVIVFTTAFFDAFLSHEFRPLFGLCNIGGDAMVFEFWCSSVRIPCVGHLQPLCVTVKNASVQNDRQLIASRPLGVCPRYAFIKSGLTEHRRRAHELFRLRHASKSYAAIVYGHVQGPCLQPNEIHALDPLREETVCQSFLW